jgi:hypothetical protein
VNLSVHTIRDRHGSRRPDQGDPRQAFEAAHPNVEILYLGPCWKAIIREDTGQTIITR